MSARIAIACGGTGGHLFPGIAVAQELRQQGHEVQLLVSPKQIDAVALKGYDFQAKKLPAIGWPGASPKTVLFGFKLLQTWINLENFFKEWKPNAILGMGGFTSAVPLWLGARRGLPVFIHESNAIPGKVTRWIAPKLNAVLTGFEEATGLLPQAKKAICTGTPVRGGVLPVAKEVALTEFGLEAGRKTILVMGGSQGAHAINQALIRSLHVWQGKHAQWQFLHLAGPDDLNLVELNYRRNRLKAKVLDFCSNMEAAYAVADFAISRSGAGSLAELAQHGIPSCLIPYPHAADNHQEANARIFERAGAALLFLQSKLESEVLPTLIEGLIGNSVEMEQMKEAALSLARPDAAERVAKAVLEAVNK